MRLHLVHGPPLPALVHWEGFQRLSVVIKLSQDALSSSRDQRTGGVAIVLKHAIEQELTSRHPQDTTLSIQCGNYMVCLKLGVYSSKMKGAN